MEAPAPRTKRVLFPEDLCFVFLISSCWNQLSIIWFPLPSFAGTRFPFFRLHSRQACIFSVSAVRRPADKYLIMPAGTRQMQSCQFLLASEFRIEEGQRQGCHAPGGQPRAAGFLANRLARFMSLTHSAGRDLTPAFCHIPTMVCAAPARAGRTFGQTPHSVWLVRLCMGRRQPR